MKLLALGKILLLLSATPAMAEVVFAAEDDWMPYTGVSGGRSVGLTVDILREALASQGVQVRFEAYPYARCMELARVSKVAGCFNTQRTPSYEPYYRYANTPLLMGGVDIYALSFQQPEIPLTVGDLEGKRVGIARGYTFGRAFDDNDKIIKDESVTEVQAFRKLRVGRTLYVVAWEGTARRILAQDPELASRVAVVGHLPEGQVDVSFARDYPGVQVLIRQFEKGMQQLAKSGRLTVLKQRWLSPDKP